MVLHVETTRILNVLKKNKKYFKKVLTK